MEVKSILPRLKANRYTYYNLSKSQIDYFKKQYLYLKKNKDEFVFNDTYSTVSYWLNLDNELDYVKKINAIKVVINNIRLKRN